MIFITLRDGTTVDIDYLIGKDIAVARLCLRCHAVNSPLGTLPYKACASVCRDSLSYELLRLIDDTFIIRDWRSDRSTLTADGNSYVHGTAREVFVCVPDASMEAAAMFLFDAESTYIPMSQGAVKGK